MARPLRWLLLAAAALVVLIVAVLVFAGTESGFGLLVRPQLAQRGIQVESARFSFGGEIEAAGLDWGTGSAERIALSLAPFSLLPGRVPHVYSLEVVALEAELAPAEDAREPEAETEGDEAPAPFAIPAFRLESAALDVRRLTSRVADGEIAWQLGPAQLTLEDWQPGHAEGALAARVEFALPAAQPPRTGTLSLEGQLGVPATEGDPLAFAQTRIELSLEPDRLALRAEPEGLVGPRSELRGPLRVERAGAPLIEDATLELAWEDGQLELAARVGRAPLAELFAALDREPPRGQAAKLVYALDAHMRLESETGLISLDPLELEQSRPGAEPVKLVARGTVRGGTEPEVELDVQGPGADGDAGSAQLSLAGSELELKVVSLDLTPLADPWLGDGEDGDAGGDESEAETAEGKAGARLAANIEIGALRFRELLLRDTRAKLESETGAWSLEIPAARLGDGSLAGRLESAAGEGGRKLAWKLDAKQLDLATLFRSLQPGSEGKLSGKLDLTSEAASSVAADADPLDALDGELVFELSDAQAEGLPFQQFMASKLAVGGLASLAFTGAEGTIPIRQGRAIFEDLYVNGNAANFRVSGDLSARDVRLSVNPRLGPRLASDLAPRFSGALFETASGALALPVAFSVEGPWEDARFLMLPAPPSLVGDVLGGASDAILGAGRRLLGGGAGDAEASESEAEAEAETESGPAEPSVASPQ